jgi:retinol dehydrogenase 12
VGKELAKILYRHNATIYLAGRDEAQAHRVADEIQQQDVNSKGCVKFLKLDLADLSTIKPAAETFMSQEKDLHVLTNLAGVYHAPENVQSAQGFCMELATNCLGPLLLTLCLLPMLQRTTSSCPPGTVRVTWASSLAVEMTPTPAGIAMTEDGTPSLPHNGDDVYAMTKSGLVFLAKEFARRYGGDSILSIV